MDIQDKIWCRWKHTKAQSSTCGEGICTAIWCGIEETFSPVAHFKTVRIILALAAQLQWPVYQFDVKSAFLNGELQEEVYVTRP